MIYTVDGAVGPLVRLFVLLSANMNVTTDQAMRKIGLFTNYIIDQILVESASISLTTAAGGIYTAASKGGVAVVGAAQTYAALTSSAKTLALTLANTDKRTTRRPIPVPPTIRGPVGPLLIRTVVEVVEDRDIVGADGEALAGVIAASERQLSVEGLRLDGP